jgi:hypothetical protein
MLRLHFNKVNGIFSIRGTDRRTVKSSERKAKIPSIGDTIELAPRVHAVITKGLYEEATTGSRPFIPVLVTRFPKARLVIKRIKEMF